jgi:hypothetical protein
METEPGAPEPRRPTWREIVGDQGAQSSDVEPPPPGLMSTAWWKKHWRKFAAVATLPFAALGGLASPPPGSMTNWSPTTSILVPTHPEEPRSYTAASLFGGAIATGGEYNLSPPWALHAGTAGRETTERLAASLVDAANKYAGGHWMSAQIRRSLIQLVLLGIGGLDPADATDILQFAADNADYPRIAPPKLEALIREIEQRIVVNPPEEPGDRPTS